MIITPLKMHPCYQEYLWGGTRLRTEYGKTDAPSVTAESWELASLSDGCSTVADGQLFGKTLSDLSDLDRDTYWGTACIEKEFPILVKLIDAKQDLSIQVHPSDQTCEPSDRERGKAEMWYVVDCEPQSAIHYGFCKQVTPEEFRRRAENGSIIQVLNRVEVNRGDVFYILPGTIHAIGAGILIAEIQQNSNTTFRIYDYLRRDAAGNLRPLHLDRAAQVVEYSPLIPEECRVNSSAHFMDFSMSEMFSCQYFRAYRLDVHTTARLACDGTSFHHVLFVEGSGTIRHGGIDYSFRQGDSFFMPAALGEYEIRGVCRALLSRV